MKKKLTKKKNQVSFSKPKTIGKRIWGEEILLNRIPKLLTLKLLRIKKNKKGGLQFHRKKNECGYILSGKLKVRFVVNGKIKSKILRAGDSFSFPPRAIHQEEALSNCQIIEASSPHLNDRVRVEKKFGIKDAEGLPTTRRKDIKYL